MTKLTSRTAISTDPDDLDLFHIVDVSDTSQDSAGSSFKMTLNKLFSTRTFVKYNCFVSKNGSDSTGKVERLDRPFLTIAAARAAMIVAYPLAGRAAAGIRLLTTVFSGIYNEQVILDNLQDYDLTNCIIDVVSGSTIYSIDDNNVACDSIIYGTAQIKRSTAGTGGTFRTQNSSSSVRIYCDYTYTSITGTNILCTNGTQTIYAKFFLQSDDGDCVKCSAGQQIINCNSIGSVNGIAVNQSGGLQVIYAYDIAGSGGNGIKTTGGIQRINADQVDSDSTVAGICAGGTQYINKARLVTGGTNTDAYTQTSGTAIINNCTFIATGTGKSITASSTVKVYGGCQGNKALGSGVTQQVGTIIIDSNVV